MKQFNWKYYFVLLLFLPVLLKVFMETDNHITFLWTFILFMGYLAWILFSGIIFYKYYKKTGLLEKSEQIVKNNGYKKIVAGNWYDYIMPGVPTSRRYFDAENEELYQELDENASDFFQKRGYIHSWNCNCFDMKLLLKNFTSECFKVGNSIDGVTYCWAELKDIEKVCACTDDAYKEFTWYYQNKGLYQEDSHSRVLVAVINGEIIGTLIITAGDECKKSGSLACITVKRAYQGRHIGVNLIYLANSYLKEKRMEVAYIGYTYTGLDHMYGYAGYKICIYYMMAEKEL